MISASCGSRGIPSLSRNFSRRSLILQISANNTCFACLALQICRHGNGHTGNGARTNEARRNCRCGAAPAGFAAAFEGRHSQASWTAFETARAVGREECAEGGVMKAVTTVCRGACDREAEGALRKGRNKEDFAWRLESSLSKATLMLLARSHRAPALGQPYLRSIVKRISAGGRLPSEARLTSAARKALKRIADRRHQLPLKVVGPTLAEMIRMRAAGIPIPLAVRVPAEKRAADLRKSSSPHRSGRRKGSKA